MRKLLTSPGSITQVIFLFAAAGLTPTEQKVGE
ncbi:hypothetical protein JOC76_001992 [Neobacillus cucumis]|nr:hypothetical protein [Neobacillus cucumis]